MNEAEITESIRNLLGAYHYFGDHGMSQEYASLFAADGVLETSGSGNYEGREVISAYLQARHDARAALDLRFSKTMHHLASVYIYDVTAESASAFSYFQVLTPLGRDHWGSYRDHLVLEDGEWRFARRIVSIDGHSDVSWRTQVPQTSPEEVTNTK